MTHKTIPERILAVLLNAPGGLTAAKITERGGFLTDQVRSALSKLSAKGAVIVIRPGGSPAGLWFHSTLRPAEPPQPVQASRIDRMAGTYTCPELYAAPSRPGAMDAYRLPSRGACDGGRQ